MDDDGRFGGVIEDVLTPRCIFLSHDAIAQLSREQLEELTARLKRRLVEEPRWRDR